MAIRGVRGATTAEANTKEAILEATKELLHSLVEANDIRLDDVAFTYFTTTPDLNAEFPAVAARQMGWNDVPLLCGHEMAVPDALPMCLRVLLVINTDKSPQAISHVYLRAAKGLRSRGIDELVSSDSPARSQGGGRKV